VEIGGFAICGLIMKIFGFDQFREVFSSLHELACCNKSYKNIGRDLAKNEDIWEV
jgi:hypothetical protein